MIHLKNYHGSITDTIHGLIKISDIEKWFLFQKPFSRLRNIRQNTFLYYVFPSANHSRFEHSIGVMYLASEVFRHCLLNFDNGQFRSIKHEVIFDGKFTFFDLRAELDGITGSEPDESMGILLQELRLAGLLHDVGHGPLSHFFDNYAITREQFLNLLRSDENLKDYEDAFMKYFGEDLTSQVEHEEISCMFILDMVNDLKKENDENPDKFIDEISSVIKRIDGMKIVKMINPKIPFPNIKIGDKDITDFLSSIISSDPIDADRMDYFLRDSYYAGVKYGVYDLSRIKTSFMAVESENKVYLGLKQSGIDSIKRFIESRYHLFNQIYMHKTNRAANTMLDYCSENIDSIKIPTDDYKQFKQFYWENSDEIFLKKTLMGKIKTDKKADFEDLLRRRVWKRIYEMKIWTEPIRNEEEKKKLKAIFKKIDSKLKSKTDIVARLDTYANSPFKEPHKTELRLIRKQSDKKYFLDKDWKSVNKDFISMDYDVYLIKIFVKRNFSSSSDFLKKKSNILSVISDELKELQDFKYTF